MPEDGAPGRAHLSLGQHLLTRIALDIPDFWARLGDLETEALGHRLGALEVRMPAYITGLPRSGSTILLQILAGIPGVATHRYSDYPFLFTPYWHNRFLARIGQRGGTPVERAHADGVRVTPGSPEAMEEILWMHFFPDAHDPSVSNVLARGVSHPAFPRYYRDHVRKLLLVRSARRYLAKNHYAVTRMQYVREIFPDARFILLVRDPVGHVASLVKQQRLFSTRYSGDPRALLRLRSMGHFEFGPGRRPVNPDDEAGTRTVMDHWREGREAHGWAWYWRLVYGFVSRLLGTDDALREATLPVRYEELCSRPGETLRAIARHCDLPDAGDAIRAAAPSIRFPSYYEANFSAEEVRAIREATAGVAEWYGYR